MSAADIKTLLDELTIRSRTIDNLIQDLLHQFEHNGVSQTVGWNVQHGISQLPQFPVLQAACDDLQRMQEEHALSLIHFRNIMDALTQNQMHMILAEARENEWSEVVWHIKQRLNPLGFKPEL